MFLRLAEGSVELVDADDLRRFKVVLAEELPLDMARARFAGIATIENHETAWVDAERLLAWPGREADVAWREGVSAMIEKARPHGWIHPETGAIRAHVERRSLSELCEDLVVGLKAAMRRLATTVTIITTVEQGAPHGMTATAVMSLSAEPPSIAVAINRSASLHDPLLRTGIFCVNLLRADHQVLCGSFSGRKAGAERFGDGGWHWAEGEPPSLDDAQASLFCRVDGQLPYGTHTLVIGRLTRVACRAEIEPLLHQNAAYGLFRPVASSPA